MESVQRRAEVAAAGEVLARLEQRRGRTAVTSEALRRRADAEKRHAKARRKGQPRRGDMEEAAPGGGPVALRMVYSRAATHGCAWVPLRGDTMRVRSGSKDSKQEYEASLVVLTGGV
eukprot:gene19166-63561_t